jgi:hypothetical protein
MNGEALPILPLLRGRPTRLPQALLILILFGLLYGAVMGSWSGLSRERFLQVVYSAVKVPMLLGVTFLIALPSFFVINTLIGLRDDFAEATRALVATQAGLTVILASFAPFTVLFYVSFDGYEPAILFNALMFGGASLSAQVLLKRFYAPLIRRDRRHRVLLRAWVFIYAFVGIQLGWTLRPFIGDPAKPPTFFREKAFTNAYEALWNVTRNAW